MRPVIRGDVPLTPQGTPMVFRDHKEARDPLIGRIGDYCSYCENVLPSDIDIEHVQPKTAKGRRPDLALTWDNFLLACTYCNRAKWQKSIELDHYFWPDVDNSFRAFIYSKDAPPIPNSNLLPIDQEKARETIKLTGLDRVPGHPNWSDRDRRHGKRKEVYGNATLLFQMYKRREVTPLSIALNAISRGFFSVWMTVFRDEIEVRKVLINQFKAAGDCFDVNTEPVRRPGGQL